MELFKEILMYLIGTIILLCLLYVYTWFTIGLIMGLLKGRLIEKYLLLK